MKYPTSPKGPGATYKAQEEGSLQWETQFWTSKAAWVSTVKMIPKRQILYI